LKLIFSMHNCINNALWDFAWFLCSHKCQYVIFNVRYWKWVMLNFSFRSFFMFVWSVSVWASVLSLLQCVNVQSAIKTNHVHHQSFCSLLHFQVLLHVSLFNIASAWLFKIKCFHVQSELIANVFDLLLIS